jgi:hypothetical protein
MTIDQDEIQVELLRGILKTLNNIKQLLQETNGNLIAMKQQEREYWETWKRSKEGK